MNYGGALRSLRIKKNMTQNDVAKALNLSNGTINRIEKDKNPSKYLNRLSDLYETSIKEIELLAEQLPKEEGPAPLYVKVDSIIPLPVIPEVTEKIQQGILSGTTGEKLTQLRELYNASYDDIQKSTGLSATLMKQLENDERRAVPAIIAQLATFYNIDISELNSNVLPQSAGPIVTQNVKAYSKKSGKKVMSILDEAKTSKATLNNYRLGKTNPSITKVKQLADAIGMTLEEILTPPAEVDIPQTSQDKITESLSRWRKRLNVTSATDKNEQSESKIKEPTSEAILLRTEGSIVATARMLFKNPKFDEKRYKNLLEMLDLVFKQEQANKPKKI